MNKSDSGSVVPKVHNVARERIDIKEVPGKMENVNLKYLSLITLTCQNALLGLSMRYGRTRSGDMFYTSTAVLMAEVVKMITCLYLIYQGEEGGKSWVKWKNSLWTTIIVNKWDTLKVGIPSLVYYIQNLLLYVAAENLDVATYQITYQLKILTTAMFAVFLLNKTLLKTQWISLLILVMGVASVQLSDAKETRVASQEQSKVTGFLAALTATVLSGFAGVYFEKILKGSQVSIWMRNLQLSMLSLPFGIMAMIWKDGDKIGQTGFFYGYDLFVWYLIILNAYGGLLVAVVVKYADNILKGFACSLAIIISSLVSIFLFGFHISILFVIGAALVIGSIFLYGYNPPKPTTSPI